MLLEDQIQNLEGTGLLDYCPSLEGWVEASGTIHIPKLHIRLRLSPRSENRGMLLAENCE